MRTLEEFLDANNMFTLMSSQHTELAPVKNVRLDECNVSNLDCGVEKRIDFDSRTVGMLDSLEKALADSGLSVREWQAKMLNKLLTAKTHIGMTLYKRTYDTEFHGVLHLHVIDQDINPHSDDWKYTPVTQNNLTASADSCDNLLIQLCVVYTESLMKRINHIDAVMEETRVKRGHLLNQFMEFTYGDLTQ